MGAALVYLDLSNNKAVQALCTYPFGRSMADVIRSYRGKMDKVSSEVVNRQQIFNAAGTALAGCKRVGKDRGERTFGQIDEVAAVAAQFLRVVREL